MYVKKFVKGILVLSFVKRLTKKCLGRQPVCKIAVLLGQTVFELQLCDLTACVKLPMRVPDACRSDAGCKS